MILIESRMDNTPVPDEVQARRSAKSCPFKPRYYSDSPVVLAIARGLADEVSALGVRQKTSKTYCRMVRFFGSLVVNFYVASVIAPSSLLGVRLRKDAYDGEFNPKTVSDGMRGLEALGYVETRVKGYWDARRQTGVTTRFEATSKLAQVLSTLCLSVVQIKERRRLVELRLSKRDRRALNKPYRSALGINKRRKKLGTKPMQVPKPEAPKTLPWPAKHRVLQARRVANLRRINTALRHQFQGIHVSDETLHSAQSEYEKPINLFASDMHRVFTTDVLKGGRFVGAWWHTLSTKEKNGELRKHIYMSAPGKAPGPTVELDYEALHFRMLYAINRVPCKTDPYLIYDDAAKSSALRKIVKSVTLVMINANSRDSALKSIRKNINQKLFREFWAKTHPGQPWPVFETDKKEDGKLALMYPGCSGLNDLLRDIEKRHPHIADYFYTGEGRRLMFDDSELAEGIMLRMIVEHGVAPLPMHDSFIVRYDYAAVLEQTMKEQFVAKFGVICPIERKPVAKGVSIVDDSTLYSRMHQLWITNNPSSCKLSLIESAEMLSVAA